MKGNQNKNKIVPSVDHKTIVIEVNVRVNVMN